MTKRMLIDATHAEETRVVVLDGNRLEDFDVESSTKKQLKGNIYLAKVVRVEASLQAAFVEYGGGRHGFLAFGEIHPDYYQIPVADRQRLLAMQAEEARAEDDDDDDGPATTAAVTAAPAPAPAPSPMPAGAEAAAMPGAPAVYGAIGYGAIEYGAATPDSPEPMGDTGPAGVAQAEEQVAHHDAGTSTAGSTTDEQSGDGQGVQAIEGEIVEPDGRFDQDPQPDTPAPEMMGGESDTFEGNGAEEARQRRTARFLRNYRIQEVIRRRQIMLIQVVKEERGTKGAALTTYISLAGRFCVLMPNSPRGGGISRKITSAADRRRLKEITAELEIPTGMGLIVRTAGAARPKPEIKRDCEYLMRLWDDIRDHTMRSMAPALIYEEASLIKRTIRDVYSRDVDEVVVDGHEGWKAAHDFMRMLMPSHAKKVQLWRTDGPGAQPLFVKHQVEAQLDSMLSPTVQLKSGGYLVINQTEALVAIDVNSGRSTRERGIEETALKTNLEAADEVARQLRLRDLAGLIVIDFIDMDAKKHNAMVERRLKEGLKNDRARIQVGYISHFGLLEMSRQRLRPSLTETNFVTCPHCNGLGHVRSIESSAVHVLRGIEEEGAKDRASVIMVHAANAIVMYLLNNKRDRIAEIENRYAMRVQFAADDSLVPPGIRIDRVRPQIPVEERVVAAPVAPMAPLLGVSDEDVADEEFEADEPEAEAEAETGDEEGRRGRSPRGRRDRGRRPDRAPAETAPEAEAAIDPVSETELAAMAAAPDGEPETAEAGARPGGDAEEQEVRRRRRRRRRGGRREAGDTTLSGEADEAGSPDAEASEFDAAEAPEDEAGSALPALPLDIPGAALPMPAELAEDGEAPVEAAGEATAEHPDGETELDENGEPRARRRGRRGGRRRRRDTPDGAIGEAAAGDNAVAAAAAGEDQPALAAIPPAPAYTGPTPADPFGGQTFDIFDMIDQAAEEDLAFQRARSARAEPVVPAEPAEQVVPAESTQPDVTEAPPQPIAEASGSPAPEPEPAAAATPDPIETAPAEPELLTTGRIGAEVTEAALPEPEPAPQASLHLPSETPPAEPADASPEPADASSEPVDASPEPGSPAIRPLVIGVDAVAVAPKKGWWRR